MLNYTTFKEAVYRELADRLPENMEVVSGFTEKNNGPVDTLFVGIADTPVRINLYVRDYYDKYLSSGDLYETLEDITNTAEQAVTGIPSVVTGSVEEFLSQPNVILPELVNTQANEIRLKNLPHRELLDMSVTYRRYFLDENGDRTGFTCVVTNADMAKCAQSEEELYNISCSANELYNVPVVHDLNSFFVDMMRKDGMPEEMVAAMEEDLGEPDPPVFIVTNQNGLYGASMLLSDAAISKAAEACGGDFYVLPSSVHEVMVVPADASVMDSAELSAMVEEINNSSVATKDRLSNNVYHYNVKTKELTQATNSRNLKTGRNMERSKGAR